MKSIKINIIVVFLILINSILLLFSTQKVEIVKKSTSIAGIDANHANTNNQYNTNYNPEFYGTIEINAHVNDNVNLKSGMYRILAKDFEDGNITNHIEIIDSTVSIDNNWVVSTAQEGNYTVTYKIIDSDKNEVVKIVPVNITKDGKRTIKRKLYDFSDSADILDLQDEKGFTRGNSQDKQNLGIYLPAEASTKIWALNELEEKIEIQYLSDNKLKESEYCIKDEPVPLYDEDKEEFKKLSLYIGSTNTKIYNYNQEYIIKNKVDVCKIGDILEPLENYDNKSYNCVPFAKTTRKNNATTLEIEINDSIKSLDYYTYDDTYNPNMENDFAVLEGSRITILLPKINFKDVGNSGKENGFNSLNDLLQYYDNLIETFDNWIGLSYNTEKTADRNVKTKYFVKADLNGIGAAYYSANSMVATNSDNITSFLEEKYNWLPLHEIGHGYQGGLAWRSQLYLGEVSNNFLAYKFQREHGVDSWLKDLELFDNKIMNEIDSSEKSYLLADNWEELPDLLNENGNVKDKFPIALFAYVNLFNKTGYIETIQNLYKHYRTDKSETTNLDLICKYVSDFSELNVIPYFERWKVYSSNEEIWEKDYAIPYYIRDLVSSDEQANIIVKDLKQEGLYSIATPDELEKYNLTGSIKINLTEETLNKLQGNSLIIKNGKKEVAKIDLNSETSYVVENISIGAYEIEISSNHITLENRYAIVKENEETVIEFNSDTVKDRELPKLKDITGDGIIDINDITAIKRHISAQTTGINVDKWTLSEEKQLVADVTGDGVIDVNDMVKMKRYIAATSDEKVAEKNPKWLEL